MHVHDRTVDLAPDEITLLIEALDSHEYWQLSEPNERNSGYSTVEDGENEDRRRRGPHREARTLTRSRQVTRRTAV